MREVDLGRKAEHLADDAFQTRLSLHAMSALDELCKKGCDREELSDLFAWLLAFKRLETSPCTGTKLPVEGAPPQRKLVIEMNVFELDSRKTAHPGFTLKKLRAVAKRATKLRNEVAKLRKTPLVGFLVDEHFIAKGDPLAGSPLHLFDGSAPFRGLLLLPKFAKQCGPKRRPTYTRIRKQIHRHIRTHTGKWNDNLFAAIYSDLFRKDPEEEKDVQRWRVRHKVISQPSPKTPKADLLGGDN
jgi:hypothetical protein